MGETLKIWINYYREQLRRHHWLSLSIKTLVIFLLFFGAAWSRLDPDFGWHLTTGNYILAHGIPRHDIYSYTAKGHTWVDHEWGSDVIQAIAYRIGGYLLDAILFSLTWTAALLIFGKRSRFWLIYLAALAILPYAGIRPIVWSVLLFSLCLWVLRQPNRLYSWLLPLMFILWANLHAGFIAGLGLIIYFAVIKRRPWLLMVFALCFIGTLINAYGIGVYVELAHTLFDPAIHNQIVEWHRFSILGDSWPYVVFWSIGFIYYARRDWRRWIEPGPILLAATLSASRNLPLFVAATVADTSLYIDRLKGLLPKTKDVLFKISYGLSLLLLLFIAVYLTINSFSLDGRNSGYPVAEVAYLQKHPCAGHIFNDYNYGGYLIWKLPGQPDYIDGRMVTWTNYMNQYEQLINKPSDYRGQFSRYHITCALLSNNDDSQNLIPILEKNGWYPAVSSNSSILLLSPNTKK